MTDGTGMPDSADALQTTYLATLLAELARLVGDAEQLVAGAPRTAPERATDIAAQQDAIVAAAHEEAAAVLAAAHSAAARVLDRAARGHRSTEDEPTGAQEPAGAGAGAGAVVDLRDATLATAPGDPAAGDQASPPIPAPPAVEATADAAASVPEPPASDDALDGDMRASLAAAIDMARGLSERIEQLSQDLHETPAAP